MREGARSETPIFRAFLVHAYTDAFKNRLYLTGRLEDGNSFGAMDSRLRPYLHILAEALPYARELLRGMAFTEEAPSLASFSGREPLSRLTFTRFNDRTRAYKLLAARGVLSPDGDMKIPETYLAEKFIRGKITIRGKSRPGRRVDLVFSNPEILPDLGPPLAYPLKVASVDIETHVPSGTIRAITTVFPDGARSRTRVLLPETASGALSQETRRGESQKNVLFSPNEASLIAGFIQDISREDPDIILGWNFLDFDFPILARRSEALGVPFTLGRSGEAAKYFPGEGGRSAAALIPGRQALDALRIARSGLGPNASPEGFSLEAISRLVLGEGKLVASSGEEKIEALERLYREDPVEFGVYCRRDGELVLEILEKTGLLRLTQERSSLTGVFLDKAWTSVVSFERIYALELRKQGIAPPPEESRTISGAAGGTILEPQPGFFPNVGVFDFRSLYPSIIRTFNIDPLAHARLDPQEESAIRAPNGAEFSRKPGPLPDLIREYWDARGRALEQGDAIAAQAYKILMNSFYGVLGTPSCRYGRSELAGAITSFARKWLLLSRDWFIRRGYDVLYGDTDSLFVSSGLGDEADYGAFVSWGSGLAEELNLFLEERIREEYGCLSHLTLRFEKPYRRFIITPIRNAGGAAGEVRGRSKGYGGWLLLRDGSCQVEVKGMEAARRDVPPLSRRLQLELLEAVFSGANLQEFQARIFAAARELQSGKLDGELVYRKRLSRPPETYTSSTPPQVKAARLLGWKGRRGTVEFVWTKNGPEPASMPQAPLDYHHYIDSLILPLAGSIAAALGWEDDFVPQGRRAARERNRRSYGMEAESGQMELDL